MNNPTSHRPAPARLNAAQVDGTACVACGCDYLTGAPVEAVPAGMVDGGQVFACAACVDEDGPTVDVTVDEDMPPQMHLVVVEHTESGILAAAFRPGLTTAERHGAVHAIGDPTVRARLLAVLANGGTA